jgi:hypothetical protein
MEHNIGDLLLAHTVDGGIMFGIITKIDESSFNKSFNLYTETWFQKNNIQDTRDYTYNNITRLKKNLEDYFNDDKV